MNIIKIHTAIVRRLTGILQRLYFHLLQKPLYQLSFNSGNNRFVCKGILINSSIKLIGGGNQVVINEGVTLKNMHIQISGRNNKLILHKDVKFYNGALITLENEGNTLEIGERSDFQGCSFIIREYDTTVTIGKDCMFSANIYVRNGDSHTIYNEHGEKVNPAKDVTIGDRVWIGYGATILKGSVIENDSIIGTQSVVTGKHIPEGSIAAGNPVKILKQGFHWGREEIR